ncbi:hypothetical protein E8D34_17185 [Nocardioides sp. GY 10113]|uniref:hypothetical protein n=1 Tax=Nocardioides sp. GY 10113 TaxID=2569761 RepID=UPI0010A8B5A6|nr:hypothetical protein [Nocardioides sp. GY 10113]TIC82215.1 hypothetical protein E8D34_17185 [Nocardioides sp. GY 10113]
MPAPVADLQRRVSIRVEQAISSPWPLRIAGLAAIAGAMMLLAAMVPIGPEWLAGVGAIVVSGTYGWALAAREGGRPFVFGAIALAFAITAVVSEQEVLRAGAAVLISAVAAVLGVMVTVPCRGYWASAREAGIALGTAAVGALASIGFEPAIRVNRYEYVVLGLALLGAFSVVYRLGAGFHGLGRRGLIVVAVGALLLAVTLLYAEMLRRYGAYTLIDQLLAVVRWSRDNLGAFPRPISAILGVPAIVYGCHMRARRRQGWWVCAFGVAATAPTATALGNPEIAAGEALLSVGFGLVVGVLLGWAVIKVDRLVTGSGPSSGGGRRVATQAVEPLRPEPHRTAALL